MKRFLSIVTKAQVMIAGGIVTYAMLKAGGTLNYVSGVIMGLSSVYVCRDALEEFYHASR